NALTPKLPLFAVFTLGRMTIAYALALAFALSYGIATAMSHRASHVLLPLLDIFQSVPVLGYLPIVFAIFLGSGTQSNHFGLRIIHRSSFRPFRLSLCSFWTNHTRRHNLRDRPTGLETLRGES